ncbi:TetR family transcriptional regulator [uncultured Sphingomonas sp.]|uniref:TetR family transcriptional regulator n=1 Tax=uncultured Sphingomonas sp. TaxID=158754 RepID=UPI0025CCFCA4|nr:TetR family transcriptional regulator [uncultured Sphingomonas sp.]
MPIHRGAAGKPSRERSPSPAPGVRAARRRNSADQLLDAASALMIERNSVHITFADIAERSGLNSALIHYRFGGKPGLFRALLERDAGGVFPHLDALIASDRSAADKLRLHVHGVIRVYWRYPYISRLVAAMTADSDSESARFLAERFTTPIAAAHAAILAQGVAEGAFRRVDPMLFYFTLFGACEHLFSARHSLCWSFGVGEIDEELSRRYADQVADTLLGGVLLRACGSA